MKVLGAFLFASILALAAAPITRAVADDMKSDSELLEVEGSGVHGTVMLVDLPAGGTLAVINVAGLTPDAGYVVVRAGSGSCDIESYGEADVIADVIANASGRATMTQELDQEIDEIATVSVWTTEDALVACSAIQP